jgi:hypothetical protein
MEREAEEAEMREERTLAGRTAGTKSASGSLSFLWTPWMEILMVTTVSGTEVVVG